MSGSDKRVGEQQSGERESAKEGRRVGGNPTLFFRVFYRMIRKGLYIG